MADSENTANRGVEISDVLAPLKNGKLISDDEFDLAYVPAVRKLSTRHWTPVKVACRAAKHLATEPGMRVLDVGSGVGKFCMVGAMTTPGTFVGVERRRHLLDEAERVCHKLGIKRVEFLHGNMADLDWSAFDAFYFYNPFFENVVAFASNNDSDPVGFQRYEAYVAIVRSKLRFLSLGTKVATYHGFGGKVPDCYELTVRERIGSDQLNVWVKTREAEPMSEAELAEVDMSEWDLASEG